MGCGHFLRRAVYEPVVERAGPGPSSHGWAGANQIAWNVETTGAFNFDRPQTCHQMIIGGLGTFNGNRTGTLPPEIISKNAHVSPPSLYRAQLRTPRGSPAVLAALGAPYGNNFYVLTAQTNSRSLPGRPVLHQRHHDDHCRADALHQHRRAGLGAKHVHELPGLERLLQRERSAAGRDGEFQSAFAQHQRNHRADRHHDAVDARWQLSARHQGPGRLQSHQRHRRSI